MATGIVTIAAFLAVRYGGSIPETVYLDINAVSDLEALLPFLRWCYVLTALGVALTSHRFVDFTAARIRVASHLMRQAEPDHATKSLLTQLVLASFGFAMLGLLPAPDLWVAIARHLGSGWLGSVSWSSLMSVGAASFGANAFAARRAL
ncbi:MAG: hypothetical protein K9G33_07620 [Sneathiella sp.]|nr:hypothetical protein [Sneathiella sp.]